MKEVSEKSFTTDVLKQPLAVVDFWASWCHPCMQFKPIFEKVATEFKDVAFCKANIEEYRDLALEYGIFSIPTVLFFKKGIEVGRYTGSMTESAFKQKITEVLK
ncbi:MAG: thioredoxin [Candidatus Woesearchaeota archaeon]